MSLDWIIGGILARSLGGLGKEDKLNYKIIVEGELKHKTNF